LPLLYNLRHLCVTMFLVAAIHGIVNVNYYHADGNAFPLDSLFLSNLHYTSLHLFPFQILGASALVILLFMAVTSHDFWLHTLTPRVWKRLHMLVYIAYVLIIFHVALGVLQSEKSPVYVLLLCFGFAAITGLHLAAAWKDSGRRKLESLTDALVSDGYVRVGFVESIPNDRAKMVMVEGQNVAIFRSSGRISAVHNLCKHQNGPLGEGKIIDGCITCPWHGYQYRPEDGCSPPPFTEKVATYRTRVVGGEVFLDPRPLPEGTPVEPSHI
jgi:methionine sulfoxide reductase heme-binding subunit